MADGGQCECGNNDPTKFWIISHNGELWGVCCKRRGCQKEYLIERFAAIHGQSMLVNNQMLYYKPPNLVDVEPEFQVRLSRNSVTKVTELQPGDHVGFDRSYLIWHHAIVVEVQANPFKLVIEGWGGSRKVRRERSEISEEDLCYMYKFNYSREVERQNPPDLVIARSGSRLHSDGEDAGIVRPFAWGDHYGVINANCEHNATYCKTGLGFCNQIAWLFANLKRVLVSFAGFAGKALVPVATEFLENLVQEITKALNFPSFAVEILENVAQGITKVANSSILEGIGLIGLTAVECYSFNCAQRKLRERLQNNEIDMEQYKVELGKRIVEFWLVVVIAGGGGLIVAAVVGTPQAEIILAPLLQVAAKVGARFLTHFMSDEWLRMFAEMGVVDIFWDIFRKMREWIIVTSHRVVNFVSTAVLPRVNAVVEAGP